MSNSKLISEIFEDFVNANTKEDKINILRKYDHPRLRLFFQYLYSPRIVFDAIVPEYQPSNLPAGLNYTYIDSEIPKLYRFIKGHGKRTNVEPKRLSAILAMVLESLHKDEADILVKLMKKDLGIKYLTPNIVMEAYPGINLT